MGGGARVFAEHDHDFAVGVGRSGTLGTIRIQETIQAGWPKGNHTLS